mmetsp:Transcript_30320/g.45096  ORF Transcript_30320/g.45096 Transcript_30320/m.45096 type:complete len:116 (+) Transcript_30320:1947-2294(+)
MNVGFVAQSPLSAQLEHSSSLSTQESSSLAPIKQLPSVSQEDDNFSVDSAAHPIEKDDERNMNANIKKKCSVTPQCLNDLPSCCVGGLDVSIIVAFGFVIEQPPKMCVFFALWLM